MGICVRHGIYNLNDIRTAYNRYTEGKNIFGEGGIQHPDDIKAKAEKFRLFLTGGNTQTEEKKPVNPQTIKDVKKGLDYYGHDEFGRNMFFALHDFDAGSLPEVVVTPTRESIALRKNIQRTIKDPILRKQFYNYIFNSDKEMDTPAISDNEKLERFMRLHKESGSPRIHVTTPHERPRYRDGLPFLNDLYIPTSYYDDEADNESNIIAELSHAYQFKNPLSDTLGLRLSIKRWAIQKIGRSSDDDGMYGRLGNYEFDAHRLIEPIMHSYISGRADDFEGNLRDTVIDAWQNPTMYSDGIDKHTEYPPFMKKAKGGFFTTP